MAFASYIRRNRQQLVNFFKQQVFIFLAAADPVILARFAREFRGFAARAPGSTKPPCYAGYFVCYSTSIFKSDLNWPLKKMMRLYIQKLQGVWK